MGTREDSSETEQPQLMHERCQLTALLSPVLSATHQLHTSLEILFFLGHGPYRDTKERYFFGCQGFCIDSAVYLIDKYTSKVRWNYKSVFHCNALNLRCSVCSDFYNYSFTFSKVV